MSVEPTEDDLRRLLADESLDVGPPERIRLARVVDAPRRRAGVALLAAVVLAVVPAVWWTVPGRRPGPPVPVAGAHTPHLALRAVPQLSVTGAVDLGDLEVLYVSYRPTRLESHEGGAVTLYRPGAFDARSFLAAARRVGSDRHFGSYPFTGDVGSVTTLAWPRPDGRWVTVQNFRGASDSGAAGEVLTLEERVAAAVVVR